MPVLLHKLDRDVLHASRLVSPMDIALILSAAVTVACSPGSADNLIRALE